MNACKSLNDNELLSLDFLADLKNQNLSHLSRENSCHRKLACEKLMQTNSTTENNFCAMFAH